MGISLVIDGDKDVSALGVDKIARTAREGVMALSEGNVDVLYLDNYLDGMMTAQDVIYNMVRALQNIELPKSIYFISSDRFKNLKNLEFLNDCLESLYEHENSKYEHLRNVNLPINGEIRALHAVITKEDV